MTTEPLSKSAYTSLRSQLDFAPSWAGSVATLALTFGTLALGLWLLLAHQGWLPFLASQLVLSVAAFQAFCVLHECGHGSFAASKWANTLVGHLVSPICVLPFFSWKYIHDQHHVWAGHVQRDPAVATLARWREREHVPWYARFCWRTWIPFVGFSQQIVFTLYPLRMWREGKATRGKVWRSAASVLWLVAAYTTLALTLPAYFRIEHFALALVAYYYLTELINLPHHTDRPAFDRRLKVWEQWIIARSCLYPPVVSELVMLNFNFHAEHHVFPTLPWYRLRRARKLVKSTLGRHYVESTGFDWVIENRRRNLADVALAGTAVMPTMESSDAIEVPPAEA